MVTIRPKPNPSFFLFDLLPKTGHLPYIEALVFYSSIFADFWVTKNVAMRYYIYIYSRYMCGLHWKFGYDKKGE